MTFRVVITARAESQAVDADEWWRGNRLAAPDLFQAEFVAVITRLKSDPNIGAVVNRGRRVVRFMVMQRTGYRVFYRVDERTAVVRVLTVWSALRGKQPQF